MCAFGAEDVASQIKRWLHVPPNLSATPELDAWNKSFLYQSKADSYTLSRCVAD